MSNRSSEDANLFSFYPLLTTPERISMQHFLQTHRLLKRKTLGVLEKKLGLIAVKKGCLKLSIASKDGREISLFSIQQGQTVVLSSHFLKGLELFNVFVEAEETTDFANLSPIHLKEFCNKNTQLEKFCLEKTLEQFSSIMHVMEQLLFTRMDQRLANYILKESNENLVLSKTHAKIAKDLGTAREVISRILNAFAKKSWINLQRGQITVLSVKALEQIAKINT